MVTKKNKIILFLITFVFLLGSFNLVQAKDIPLSNCQEIHFAGNYYLTDDITVDSNEFDICFDIYVNNVEIDGRGHTIYADDMVNVIIEADFVRNTIIKNIDLRYGAECISTYYSNETTIFNSSLNCINDDLDLGPGYGVYIYNNNMTGSDSECIGLFSIKNAQVHNNNLDCIEDGIYLVNSGNAMINNNKILSGWNSISVFNSLNGNMIYNNYLKGYNKPIWILNSSPISLNIPKQLGTNIIGGRYLGGNYYINYAHNGYSDTCFDGNRDGICDRSYSINGSTDYYPLTKNNPFVPVIGKNN